MSYAKKISIAVLTAFFSFALYYVFFRPVPAMETKTPVIGEVSRMADENASTENDTPVPDRPPGIRNEDVELPESVFLDVPFLVQAPYANWDPLHEDACEEASLLMVWHFLKKDRSIPLSQGDAEMIEMVRYEESIGYGLSITMDQLARVAENHLKMENIRVEKDITVDDIKRELAAGRPVIVPAAGKILPNPYFRDGGPVYHMLVVTGYDKKGFITNDPGTKRGEGFRYTFNALYDAIHDWDEENILNGQKAYLVFD